MAIPGVPSMLPEIRTGGVTPSATASVRETSTWLSPRSGPRITTFFSSPLGPARVTRSAQANCPGWLKSFTRFSW